MRKEGLLTNCVEVSEESEIQKNTSHNLTIYNRNLNNPQPANPQSLLSTIKPCSDNALTG